MCHFTFTLQRADELCVVAVTDELLLHAEPPNVCDFFHIRQILVLVVHPPADGALPLKKKKKKTSSFHMTNLQTYKLFPSQRPFWVH